MKYICEICDTIYNTPELAIACENQPMEELPFAVGDFVVESGGLVWPRFGWFDGDERWAIKVSRGRYTLIYVVTAITYAGHEARIHVETLAMTGENGHRGGWTSMTGHRTMQKHNPGDLDTNGITIGQTFVGLL